MKRDMEIIRQLLTDLEAHNYPAQPLLAVDQPHVVYQVWLMKEAGLIEAVIRKDTMGLPGDAVLMSLTWAGHDFLDAARDNTIWKKAMEHIVKPGASWTFSLLSEWLKQQARQRIFGLSPDLSK